ncbi:MAG: histidine phosphatase family protein [Brumimicrobium sp.]
MKLFVLRHAKTERQSSSGKDFDRDINQKGFSQLGLMSNYLKDNYFENSFRVFCSSAERTRTTFNEIKDNLNYDKVTFHSDIYLPSLQELLLFIWKQNVSNSDILLIGHNDGLSDLCNYISDDNYLLPTCGLVVFDFPEFSNSNQISENTGVELDRYYPIVE